MATTKSFTALPAMASVAAKQTAAAFNCHARGFEKVIWPLAAMLVNITAMVCFIAAIASPMWVQINLHDVTSFEDKGYVILGIFSGSLSIELQQDVFDQRVELFFSVSDENLMDFQPDRMYAAFTFSLIAVIICVALIPIIFINTYQTVTTWWRGPPMIYILSTIATLIGFIATGLFTDFYLWDLNPDTLVLDLYNLERAEQPRTDALNYLKIPNMHYSSWLQIGASILMSVVILIAWRLLALLPVDKIRNKEAEDDGPGAEMVQLGGGATILPTTNMAMSMQAAAAMGQHASKQQQESFVTSDAGMF